MLGFVGTSFSGIKINSKEGSGGEGRLSTHIRQTNTEASGSGRRGVGGGGGLNINKQGLHISCVTRTLQRSLRESAVCEGTKVRRMRFAFNSMKKNPEGLDGWC